MKIKPLLLSALVASMSLTVNPAGASAHGKVGHVTHSHATSHTYGSIQPALIAAGLGNADPYDQFSDISCSAPGYCTAAGSFLTADGSNLPMTETSTAGVWALVVPADTEPFGAGQGAGSFNSISCSAPGFCTAAGVYRGQAITATSENGIWSPLRAAQFDPSVTRNYDGPSDLFNSVSCSSSGNCTAVGGVSNFDGYRVPMMQTMTNGVWDLAHVAAIPDKYSTQPDNSFSSVSCASNGNCTAGGATYSWDTNTFFTFISTSTDGVWGEMVLVADTQFTRFSCTAPGDCSAAGSDDESGFNTAATITSTNGVWASPVVVSIDPLTQYPGYHESYFADISCSSPGNCSAVGYANDVQWNSRPLVRQSVDGVWGQVTFPAYSTAATGPEHYAYLSSVSCTAPQACTAAGTVADTNGNYMAATTTLTSTGWGDMVIAPMGSTPTSHPRADSFNTISCSTPTTCTAAGTFTDSSGNYPAMTESLTGPAPDAPTGVSALGAPGHVIVSWNSPSSAAGDISSYRVTVLRGNTVMTQQDVSPASTQTIATLSPGTYRVTVAAVNSNGSSVEVAAPGVSIPSSAGVRIPPAPRALSAVVLSGALRISWLPPALSDGGSPIYQYIVSDGHGHGCVSGHDARRSAATFTCVIRGLTNGQRYGWAVRAVNIMGTSVASPLLWLSPASAPITAPSISLDSVTSHRVIINVTAPSDMGGRPLHGYVVSFDRGHTWSPAMFDATTGQITLGALTSSTTLRIDIAATNQMGRSPAVSLSVATP